jgi:prolyl-tRNA synthetase
MKDAYSFDLDEAGAEKSYMDMYDAYMRIFERCGFNFRAVEADTGQIGGSFSHEFMVLADTGEDIIISCGSCGYAANLERAEVGFIDRDVARTKGKFTNVDTPGQRKIDEVSRFLGVAPDKLVKTIIYNTDKGAIGVLVKGDREINEVKLRNMFNLESMELADEETIEKVTGGPLGFSGPIGLDIPLYADRDVLFMEDFVAGGNARDVHTINVNIEDFKVEGYYDLKVAEPGDLCSRCGGTHTSTKGIEVGHIFKLGTKYSKAMNCTFLDKEGKEKLAVMGCYGIGVGRTVAASIEQGHDENGMVMPFAIAPFEVCVLPVNSSHAESMELAEAVYKELMDKGIDAIIDDRPERPGVKFKDCDLIGIPIRVTIGERNLKDGLVEIKLRKEKDSQKVRKEEVIERVLHYAHEFKRR